MLASAALLLSSLFFTTVLAAADHNRYHLMSQTYSDVPPTRVPPEFFPSARKKLSALSFAAEQIFLRHITHICSVSFSHEGVFLSSSVLRPSEPGGMAEDSRSTFRDDILFPSWCSMAFSINE